MTKIKYCIKLINYKKIFLVKKKQKIRKNTCNKPNNLV